MLNICQTGTLPNSPDIIDCIIDCKSHHPEKHSTEVALSLIMRPNIRSEVAVPASRFCPLSSELSFT